MTVHQDRLSPSQSLVSPWNVRLEPRDLRITVAQYCSQLWARVLYYFKSLLGSWNSIRETYQTCSTVCQIFVSHRVSIFIISLTLSIFPSFSPIPHTLWLSLPLCIPRDSVTPSPANASREEVAEVKLQGSGSGESARIPMRWGVGGIFGIFRHVYTWSQSSNSTLPLPALLGWKSSRFLCADGLVFGSSPLPVPTCIPGSWLQAAGTQGPRRDSDCGKANAFSTC